MFTQSFLSECSFRVRVGPTLSELQKQGVGGPQGSILSPALFSIKINNIVNAVLNGTDCSLFVDDFVCTGKLLCINSIQDWVCENGFTFSTSKMMCNSMDFPQTGASFWESNLLK